MLLYLCNLCCAPAAGPTFGSIELQARGHNVRIDVACVPREEKKGQTGSLSGVT